MDSEDQNKTENFLQETTRLFNGRSPNTTAQHSSPASQQSALLRRQSHPTPVHSSGGMGGGAPGLPPSPAVSSWSPGPAGASELVAGFASAAQAEAMLSVTTDATHDHLLPPNSPTGSLTDSRAARQSI